MPDNVAIFAIGPPNTVNDESALTMLKAHADFVEAQLPGTKTFKTVAEIDAEIARLQNEKKMLWPKTVRLNVTLNQDETSLQEIADDFSFSWDDIQRWENVCKDLDVTVLVEKDGSAWITEVGGAKLERKISAN